MKKINKSWKDFFVYLGKITCVSLVWLPCCYSQIHSFDFLKLNFVESPFLGTRKRLTFYVKSLHDNKIWKFSFLTFWANKCY